MRKALSFLLFLLCFCGRVRAEYIDHRGHNVDSLETVMAGWTAGMLDEAGEPTSATTV